MDRERHRATSLRKLHVACGPVPLSIHAARSATSGGPSVRLRCSVAPCKTVPSAPPITAAPQPTLHALNGGSHERRLRDVDERQRRCLHLIEGALRGVQV